MFGSIFARWDEEGKMNRAWKGVQWTVITCYHLVTFVQSCGPGQKRDLPNLLEQLSLMQWLSAYINMP